MRNLFLLLFFPTLTFGQTNIYLFPGQGSDERIFSKLKLDSTFTLHFVKYPTPSKTTKLNEFALELAQNIDTTNAFILIGVSMGGMICSEISDILKPQKTIIISSAKCRKELPLRYKFQKYIPINRLIPSKLVYWGANFLQPLVEPDRNSEKDTFKSMLSAKPPKYLKRTANMIINWDKKTYSNQIIHIHRTNDHTLPLRKVRANFIIKNGSHMMTLTKSIEINTIINQLITDL